MKISLVGPVYPYRGGISHFTTLLSRALKDNGHHIQLVSFKRQYPNWLYPGKSDKDPSKRPLRVEAEFLLDPFYPWTWYQTAKRILRFHPDMVVIQWWTTFWAFPYAVLTAYLDKKDYPVVYLIHNVIPHEPRIWDPWLAKLALTNGRAFLVQSQIEKERLIDLLPNARINVNELPVSNMFLDKRLSKVEARKSSGLPDGKSIMLFFGIVRPYKGLRYLLEALSLVQDQDVDLKLVIAGEFWEDKKIYTKIIKERHLCENVIIIDHYIPDEEVPVLFSAADFLVVPYTSGTQSSVANIALGYGMPLIVTEIVAQGVHEKNRNKLIVVPPGDSIALAKAIQNLVQNPISGENVLPSASDDWAITVSILEKFLG
ncbi:MAG: glycosyltransferase [Anaerolineales bacterium]